MAGTGARTFPLFFVCLLLLGISDATLISTSPGLFVTGRLCCTQNGNCPGNSVPGAVVTLRCSSFLIFTSVVGQNTTDPGGFFSITAPTAIFSISGLPTPCFVNVQLPLNPTICPVLANTNGVLNGILTTNGTVVDQKLGVIQAARVLVFIRSDSLII